MKILEIMNSGIGNMVMLTPSLRALREVNLDAQITVLCKEPAAEVIRGWLVIDSVITELDDSHYDLCIVTRGSNDYFLKNENVLMNQCDRIKSACLLRMGEHEASQHLSLIRSLGYQGDLPAPFCQTEEVELPWASDDKVAILSDTAFQGELWRRKKWPYYPSLALLLQQRGYLVTLVGGRDEALAFKTRGWPEGIINLMGEYTIPQTAWIIQQADIFVGNDSGPAHISGAVGTKTFVLFGATRIDKNKPLGADVTVISNNLSCAPCQYTAMWNKCTEWQCMNTLMASSVMEAIEVPKRVMNTRETISACIIVKDAEESIERTLESINGQVDEIVIVIDTRTTDRTAHIIRKWSDKSLCPVPVWSHEFNGFSDARNFAADKAAYDVILVIDADEELAPGCNLRDEIDPEFDIISMSVISPVGAQASLLPVSDRIYRKGKAHYERFAHNRLVTDGTCTFKAGSGRIIHSGYALSPEKMMAKYKRTEALLEKDIAHNAKNGVNLAYDYMCLSQCYRNQYRWKDVITVFHTMQWVFESSPQAIQHTTCDVVISYMELGEHDKAIATALKLLEKYPDNLDANYHIGMTYFSIKEWESAAKYLSFYLILLDEILAPGFMTDLILITAGSKATAWNNIGITAIRQGDINGGLWAFHEATEASDDPGMRDNFKKMLLHSICSDSSDIAADNSDDNEQLDIAAGG